MPVGNTGSTFLIVILN